MPYALLFCLLTFSSLFANPVDPSSTSFALRKEKERVDLFDFPGEYAHLKNIDIDAIRKKKVEISLKGEYPLLESINYEGGFGTLKSALTGKFPLLQSVNFLCKSCAMEIDLAGSWEQSCHIVIHGMKEDITLTLPKDIGLVVHTKTAPKGKVINECDLKKKGWFSLLNKTYYNESSTSSDLVLTLEIETTDGCIILKQ